MATFQELNLSKEILKVIEEIGYENPTPIQEQSIPAILNGLLAVRRAYQQTVDDRHGLTSSRLRQRRRFLYQKGHLCWCLLPLPR